jgi:exodeoxyribonuclease-5
MGDPFQLPPVKGVGYFTGVEPDVLLTEVHRQAAGSGILELATRVREGRKFGYGTINGCTVTDRVTAAQAQAADQVLCGTNRMRQAINARHRQLAGHDHSVMPQVGEKLCCLKNDHEAGLLNGTTWVVTQPSVWEPGEATVGLWIVPEGGGAEQLVPAEAELFLDEGARVGWGSQAQFTFGSCLTVHKSQGSSWPSVVLFDDWPGTGVEYRRHLYTGITRASEKLIVVRN